MGRGGSLLYMGRGGNLFYIYILSRGCSLILYVGINNIRHNVNTMVANKSSNVRLNKLIIPALILLDSDIIKQR